MKFAFFLSVFFGCSAVASTTDPHPAASAGSLFQVLLALIVVLALMAAVAWCLKRFGVAKAASSGTAVKIVGGISVGNRERILVIEVADQWIVVGVAPGCINALANMPRQENAAASEQTPLSRNFSSWLAQTINRRNEKPA